MSEAYGEWLVRHDHPLLNNVILKIVFEQLGKKDLKECRLVCKTWNVSSIPSTREVYTVVIHGNSSTKIHTLENFVDAFRSNKLGIPFAKFVLEPFCTADGVGQEFLQLCGKTIQSVQFRSGEFMVEDMVELLRATPKLEVFYVPGVLRSRSTGVVKLFSDNSKPELTSLKKLTVWHDNPEERNKFCPTFLEELITAAENISSFNLFDTPNFDGRMMDPTSLKVLNLIEKLGRESSIQELKIHNPILDGSKHLEILCKLTTKPRKLKLKKFFFNTVTSESGQENCTWLFNFLTKFSDTLEDFTVGERGTVNFMAFPKFPHLKKFSIHLTHAFCSRSVNLKKIFPVLEELRIWQFITRQCREFFPESDPCSTVKSFLPFHVDFSINAFNQMLIVFPNLTNLRVYISLDGAEILRRIWSQMPQLESLDIRGTMHTNDSLDSLLTGIPIHALREIQDTIANLDKIPPELERRELILKLRNQHSQLPSITDLTNLKSLTLDQSGVSGVFGGANANDEGTGKLLTDLSGYLGFYSMSNLKHLTVGHSQLTKTCCEIITQDMKLESWSFRTGGVEIIPSLCREQLSSSGFY